MWLRWIWLVVAIQISIPTCESVLACITIVSTIVSAWSMSSRLLHLHMCIHILSRGTLSRSTLSSLSLVLTPHPASITVVVLAHSPSALTTSMPVQLGVGLWVIGLVLHSGAAGLDTRAADYWNEIHEKTENIQAENIAYNPLCLTN